jgi:WD40 repeat protein
MANIFLSHSSQDNDVAGDVSRRLKEHGYDSLFLDFDPDSGIKAGHDWERELYRNLRLADAVVVLCSPQSMASRWCFVEIAQAKALGKAVFPIIISPCRIENILKDRQVIDLTEVGVDEAYRRLLDGLRAAGLDPWDSFHWDSRRPPFPGLNYFDAEDAGIYFGRDDEVRQVIETLTRMRRQGEPLLLVVVGSSGSGKSSLIRAGVIPRLGKDRSRWALVAPFRPGEEPISELARALFSAFPESPGRPDWKAIRDRLRDESRAANHREGPNALATSALTEYADELTMLLGRREASVLLVVDQAEELLQDAGGDRASAFFDVLRRATERRGGRVFGLLTLRSDFLGSFQNHPALRGVAFADLPIGPLPAERFPMVIEGPADRAAIALEPGLVSAMIADARTDDALPLLAFTLREMYERSREQERFTLKVYRDELGGIKGAVARVVERIKHEVPWTPEVDRALRRAFLKLVRVNDEGQFIRQPCRWADLPDLAARVLEAFVKARLLSSNGDVVEVTHESLFRVWPELAGWLDESRELMLWKKHIQDEVKDWIAHGRLPDRLLSGARVAEARRWLASNADDFPAAQTEFLAASVTAEDDRMARERVQQEKLRHLARSLVVGVVVASALALIAIGMGGYALVKRDQANKAADLAKAQAFLAEGAANEAKAQTRIATSRQLAALSVAERDKRFDRSLLLAVEAFQAANTSEARESLYQALQSRPGLTSFLHINEGCARSVAFSRDGKTIAAGFDSVGSHGGVVLWDVVRRKRLVDKPLPVEEGGVTSVAFSPDGQTITAGYDIDTDAVLDIVGGGVVLWDVAKRRRLVDEPLPVREGPVTSVAFSPDGETIAAGFEGGGVDGGVVLWNAATHKRLVDGPLPVKEGRVTSVAFSPDGKAITAGYNFDTDAIRGIGGGGVLLWDVATGKRLIGRSFPVKEGGVWSVAFSPDGKTIAGGFHGRGNAGGVVLWNKATHKRLLEEPLPVREGGVGSVAFSSDGKTIAAEYLVGNNDHGGVVLWNVATRKRLVDEPLPVKEGRVMSVAFSPDGKTIATGFEGRGFDSGVVLWDVAIRKCLVGERLPAKEGRDWSVAFSPDGKTIAGGFEGSGVDAGLVLWNVATGERLVDKPLPLKDGGVKSVAFSPDGKTIAGGFEGSGVDGGVVLWNVATRERVVDKPLPVKEGGVTSVAFSPDGQTIAAGYNFDTDAILGIGGGGVVLWDVATRERLVGGPLPVKEGKVRSVAFSPDGKTVAAGFHGRGNAGGVVLWNAATHKRLVDEPLPVKEGGVWSVAFSPDGKTIAAGFRGSAGGVVLWNAATHKRLVDEPLPVKEGGVWSVAFSPDGKTIAAGFHGSAGGVVLWEVATRKRLVAEPLPVKEGWVVSVALSPGGKSVAAGFTNLFVGGVVLWDIDLESWQRRAGLIANRNFTEKEWRDYFPETPYRATFPEFPLPSDLSLR